MKAAELRNKTIDELRSELMSLLKEKLNLRFQQGMGQLAKPHLLKSVKLKIARVKTMLKEKGCRV